MGKRKVGMARQNRTIRLSESELRKLAEGAKAAGMSESEYVRHLIMHGGVDADYIRDRQNNQTDNRSCYECKSGSQMGE